MSVPQLERELEALGWHLFYVVDPSPKMSAFAFDRNRAITAALQELLGRAESRHLNAAEITNIRTRRFGPSYLATVKINFRHIGETPVLFEKRKRETGFRQHSMASRAA
jgi:hypothetical protein